jgi:UDP-N-acetylglucosamine 2-epimerase (non-hydrolysing)
MVPVVKALQGAPWARCRVLATAQHRHLLDQMLEFFGVRADIDLDIMTENQRLPKLTANLITRLDRTFTDEKPDIVLAQGDTTTVFASALASFYQKIPFGHVEAGLRSHNLNSPFPEEANRLLAGHLTTLHFAPTPQARANLLREGIPDGRITVTGNTVIDALFMAAEREEPIGIPLDPARRLILVTAHRRDSFGAPIHQICEAVRELCQKHPDVQVLWPVHPNPAVRPVVEAAMKGQSHVHLCEPLSYGPFVTAMKRAYIILTDSGGVQEEAPALRKPVLVMRNESERPEAIDAGVAVLVGPNRERIVAEADRLLSDPAAYEQMARGASPYGDGNAAGRIVTKMADYFEIAGDGLR